jgi:hypothetical protein
MTGNVAFMFVCTIMVFFMTPGLAFFYGGMVRRKNALNTMMFCMAMMGIGMLLWFLCGYSLSFGKDHAGIIGDLNNVLMRNVSWEVTGGETYDEVKKRLQQFFDELTDKHPDENVLVVSHGFTIKLILDLFLNIGNLVNLNEPTNAGITKFVLKNGARTLVYFNK